MKKHLYISLAIIASVLALPILVQAAYLGKPFGGRILNTTAFQIQMLENMNYGCTVPGSSLWINPLKNSPSDYLLPSGVSPKTDNGVRSGQWILGLYNKTKTTITCIFQGEPPETQTVDLNPIKLFGTSRK